MELLLSMTLFLVVMVPLTRFLITTAGTDRAGDIRTATGLARDRIEMLRLKPVQPMDEPTVERNGRTYRIVTDLADQDGLRRVTVRVYRGDETVPLAELVALVGPEAGGP